MILEKFGTNKYDDKVLFVNPDVTYREFKKHVCGQVEEFLKSKCENVVLFGDNYFDFSVNFFSAVFAQKNIYLITDKTRLKQLDFEYILPQKSTPKSGDFYKNLNSKDVEIRFFTSGSTGKPKTIMKTLYNLEVEAQSTVDEFNIREGGIVASTTSSSHSFGIAFNFILPFYAGLRINQKKIEFPEQFDVVGDYILISSPSFMQKLVKYDYIFDNPPKQMFLAGAKLDKETLEYLKKYSDVVDIYGSTETGNIAFKREDKVFTVISNVEVTTTSDNEIVVESEFFPESKTILSDIIEFVGDKKFILKKRADRLVKIQEKRISLDEIEGIIKKYPDVDDCYCFVEDDKLCCAIATKNIALEVQSIKKFALNYSEIVPKKWRILDEIPKNEAGKTDKNKLNKIFGMNLSLPFVVSRNISENSAEIELVFKHNCNFFKGHFDAMPILPGVVQLYYARYFIEDVLGIELGYSEVKKVKFSNIINPDMKVKLVLKNNEKSVEYTYLADDKIFSSGIFIK